MTIIRLAHYAIHTSDLEASRRFYTEVMGFRVGYRPSFPFPGIWLYQHEEQSEFGIVHIIGLDPDDPKNLEGYWGIGSNKPRSGTDSFDHIAFLAKDWPQMRTRCQAHRVDYVERSVPELGLHQVFLVDPSGITLELNYPASEGMQNKNMRTQAACPSPWDTQQGSASPPEMKLAIGGGGARASFGARLPKI